MRNSSTKEFGIGITWSLKDNKENLTDIANNYFVNKKPKLSLKNITINSNPALYAETEGSYPNNETYFQYFVFLEQDPFHKIIIHSPEIFPGKNESEKILFDQILSTFKFTK